MSVVCGAECFLAVGCLRWLWKRCTYVGADDSATWPQATAAEFESVPHLCRIILAVYEEDLHHPKSPPLGGYRLNPNFVHKRVTYQETLGQAPPYLIYLDHDRKEIVLAIRGLNLKKESDYKLLLNNRLGMQMFDGGYVHHGLLKSAIWLLNKESENLKHLWLENGACYKMVFVGHSLGSGVAALLTVIVVNHRDRLGGIPRDLVRCFALAPARCMSLNLAVKYADVIYSVVLQDDFLPRTATPLEDIFKSIFCLPCLIFLVCLRDTFIPEGRKLKDPRRLYAPGRIYHIVERKFCRCGRYPPEVRTAIPVDGRFEHIVLSSHATADHAIIWIHREAEKALNLMKEKSSETMTTAPAVQKFDRLQSIEKEHKDALERAVTLNIPHAVDANENEDEDENEPQESLSASTDSEDQSSADKLASKHQDLGDISGGRDTSTTKSEPGETKWDILVERLFERSDSGKFKARKDININTSDT
ncbi:putative fungal lipase-like domain, mono-/di-acylglycerol lipase, alpha/Beta hydrolase [Helianthus anomalus]